MTGFKNHVLVRFGLKTNAKLTKAQNAQNKILCGFPIGKPPKAFWKRHRKLIEQVRAAFLSLRRLAALKCPIPGMLERVAEETAQDQTVGRESAREQ